MIYETRRRKKAAEEEEGVEQNFMTVIWIFGDSLEP